MERQRKIGERGGTANRNIRSYLCPRKNDRGLIKERLTKKKKEGEQHIHSRGQINTTQEKDKVWTTKKKHYFLGRTEELDEASLRRIFCKSDVVKWWIAWVNGIPNGWGPHKRVKELERYYASISHPPLQKEKKILTQTAEGARRLGGGGKGPKTTRFWF